MMLTPPWQRGQETYRPTSIAPRRRLARIANLETFEGRQLLATVLPSPTGAPPVEVTAAPPALALPTNPGQNIPAPLRTIYPTGAPVVTNTQFEPLTGRILVQFGADEVGYDPAVLTNPANYSFSLLQAFEQQPAKSHSRPKAGIVLPPPYVVTGVALANPTAPGMPPTVIVSINNNEPLRFGIYGFEIHSAGLTDLAGQPLNGQFNGSFPSGNVQGGGDFVAILTEVNSTVLPALTAGPLPAPDVPPGIKPPNPLLGNPPGITPSYVYLPTTRAVRVRYLAAKPGGFMLAGGNNISLKALRNQFFPGIYRLPALDPAAIPHPKSHAKK